jgi:hypothetical protein
MTTLAKLITDLRRKLTGTTTELQSEIARLRSEITERSKALQHAQRAPLPVEEIMATRIPRVVEEHGRRWLDEHGSTLISSDRDRALGSPGLRGSIYLPWADALPWGALCAARPDLAREILAALVGQVAYEPGPPLAERPALIARLERELAELEQGEEQIVDEACGSGVVIEHRPAVRERRQAEAARQRREEEAATNRKAREAEINRQFEEARARGRAARSPYLERETRATTTKS